MEIKPVRLRAVLSWGNCGFYKCESEINVGGFLDVCSGGFLVGRGLERTAGKMPRTHGRQDAYLTV
jgi:hypothetical protein